jgi:primosomal protein N' (replication factor Y)
MAPKALSLSRDRYVRVAVNAGRPTRITFSYRVPPGRLVQAGDVVHVPFGQRTLQGIVVEGPIDLPGYAGEIREIEPPVKGAPGLGSLQLELAAWVIDEYLAPQWEAHALMLPPGSGERPRTFVVRGDADLPEALSERQQQLYALLSDTPRDVAELRAASFTRGFDAALSALVRRRLAERRYELDRPRGRPRVIEVVRLKESPERARQFADGIEGRRNSRRARVLSALLNTDAPIPFDELAKIARGASVVEALIADGQLEIDVQRFVTLSITPEEAIAFVHALTHTRAQNAAIRLLKRLAVAPERALPVTELRRDLGSGSSEALRILKDAGLLWIEEVLDRRDPLRNLEFVERPPVDLIFEQRAVALAIRAAIDRGDGSSFLLQGVTGSGKTEVYLDAFQHAIDQGKRGLVLVPEIALTPQTVARFAARFPGRVGVLNSGLSLGQSYDEWHATAAGAYDVVIGSRSAIFAPQPDLGLIVLDEAHEWTYKQREPAPRYDARSVAQRLAALSGAALVFGTATPDAERWYSAIEGRITRLDLPRRMRAVRQPDGQTRVWPDEGLPEINVVDVRGQRSLFSEELVAALSETLDRDEQALLFLNRRGFAGYLLCPRGHSPTCASCDVALALHESPGRLLCHQCNRSLRLPPRCRDCNGHLRPARAGTQAVEREVLRLFPNARVVRWDRDTARSREQHEKILGQLQRHEVDVLVGTQMIAKGLDLPLITLVGVVLADHGLRSGDFRARERTFQLLEQVAGRAGRAERHGRVIVQTFSPEDRAIEALVAHDVDGFFEDELRWRAEFRYPPFQRLARLVFSHTSGDYAAEEAYRMQSELRKITSGLPGVDILGPAPPQIARIRGRHRWALLVRAPNPAEILRDVEIPLGWVIDVDPVTLD